MPVLRHLNNHLDCSFALTLVSASCSEGKWIFFELHDDLVLLWKKERLLETGSLLLRRCSRVSQGPSVHARSFVPLQPPGCPRARRGPPCGGRSASCPRHTPASEGQAAALCLLREARPPFPGVRIWRRRFGGLLGLVGPARGKAGPRRRTLCSPGLEKWAQSLSSGPGSSDSAPTSGSS